MSRTFGSSRRKDRFTLEADVCHYKVCSTLDSSPEIGNVGRALENGFDGIVLDPVALSGEETDAEIASAMDILCRGKSVIL